MFSVRSFRSSVSSRVPSPICLGSVSPSPYKVARHKSPTEPRTAPYTLNSAGETQAQHLSRYLNDGTVLLFLDMGSALDKVHTEYVLSSFLAILGEDRKSEFLGWREERPDP